MSEMETFEFELDEVEELEPVESLWFILLGSGWFAICP